MRISDWSSDVCSSDLGATTRKPFGPYCRRARRLRLAISMMLSSGRVCVGGGITASQRARQNRKPNRIRAESAENAEIFVHAETRRRGEDEIGGFAALFLCELCALCANIFYLRVSAPSRGPFRKARPALVWVRRAGTCAAAWGRRGAGQDRKSTRLNSSH